MIVARRVVWQRSSADQPAARSRASIAVAAFARFAGLRRARDFLSQMSTPVTLSIATASPVQGSVKLFGVD